MPEIPSFLIAPLVILGGIALMNVLRDENPGKAVLQLLGGLTVLAAVVVVVATIARLGWKVFQFAWS